MSGWNTSDVAAVYTRRGELNPLAAACGDGKRPVHQKPTNLYAPYKSKVEFNYASQLELMKLAGVIKSWEYEPDKWRLGFACFYTPDFRVTLADGSVEWHETKGRQTRKRKDGSTFYSFWAPPKNWQKLKIAAAKWPERAIFVVFPGDHRMATWNKQRVPAGEQI